MSTLLVALALATGFLKGQLHAHSNRSGDSATPPAEVARWYAEHDYDFIVLTDHDRITSAPAVGSMLVIPGVELTQNLPTCEPPPAPGLRYQSALAATRTLGGIAQLNHPTFHLAANAAMVRQLVKDGLTLLEIANQSWDVDNAPPGSPSTETIWDDLLSSGGVVWATATDDAHHYYDAQARAAAGEAVFSGDRGFVMVHATGVRLARIDRSASRLEVEVEGKRPCRIRFIGTGGKLLQVGRTTVGTLDLSRLRDYVRVVVEDDSGHRAFTQPIFLSK